MKRALTLVELIVGTLIILMLVIACWLAYGFANTIWRIKSEPLALGYTQIGTKTITICGLNVSVQIIQNPQGDKFYMYTKDGVSTFIPITE